MAAPNTLLGVSHGVHRIVDSELPHEIDEWSRWALLDTIAVLIGGATTRVARAALGAVQHHPGPASLLITPQQASRQWAALVLASSANALDYDDGHVRGGGIHAGSTVLPVLLSAAPGTLSLRRLRAALVAGYEVAIRAGALASPENSGHDYRTSGYAATIGAAASLAAATSAPGDELAPPRTAGILRTAAAHAPVSSFISGGARESIGWAAATAVSAMELVDAGLLPPCEESRLRTPAGPTLFDRPLPFGAVGETFEALNCYVKPYACCRAAHAAIDGVLALARQGHLDPRANTPIVVRLPSGAATLTETRPVELGEAQFALPFLLGVALTHGPRELQHLGRGDLAALFADAAVARNTDRVVLLADPGLDHNPGSDYPAIVVVTKADDTTASSEQLSVFGSAESPLPATARLEKARDLLLPHYGEAGTTALIELCLDPRDESTLETLLSALTQSAH